MLHLSEAAKLIIKRTPLVRGLLFAAVLALLPTLAPAQCKNWEASGAWEIRQRGAGDHITVRLEQNGRVLTGSADYQARGPNAFDAAYVTGRVDGTIDGDRFSVQIFWPDNLTGVYNATVLPSGRLDGVTYDKNNPKIGETWNSQNPLKCAPPPPIKESGKAKPTPTPPSPKPILHSGAARVDPPPPPPPPMKVPGIVASQVLFPARISSTGLVVLTWDAGPDHPYAEVWFKVNGGDDVFVVERGKGSLQVPVERGRQYVYILTDAGTTLDTVSFIVPSH